MPTYELTINFEQPGLETLFRAAQQVTLVKSVAGNAGSPLAWVTFSPMTTNTITWTDNYSLYASTTQIQNGAQIVTNSQTPASGGTTYTFLPQNYFGDPIPGLPSTDYGVLNKSNITSGGDVQMITSGLYQTATVNGTPTSSPLNAVGVPYGDTAVFTPIEKVQIFTSSYQDNGLVISAVKSQALTVDFTFQPNQSIYYDASVNQFAPGSPVTQGRTV